MHKRRHSLTEDNYVFKEQCSESSELTSRKEIQNASNFSLLEDKRGNIMTSFKLESSDMFVSMHSLVSLFDCSSSTMDWSLTM